MLDIQKIIIEAVPDCNFIKAHSKEEIAQLSAIQELIDKYGLEKLYASINIAIKKIVEENTAKNYYQRTENEALVVYGLQAGLEPLDNDKRLYCTLLCYLHPLNETILTNLQEKLPSANSFVIIIKLDPAKPQETELSSSAAYESSLLMAPQAHASTSLEQLGLYAASSSSASSASASEKKLKVLIADDDVTARKTHSAKMKKTLTDYNLEIIFATNGKEAVENWHSHVASEPIRLILMDSQMPLLDGEQAAMQIRQLEKNNHLSPPSYIINVSAKNEKPSISFGFNAVLLKPLNPDELRNEVMQFKQLCLGQPTQKPSVNASSLATP